jgi:hypothetical protein
MTDYHYWIVAESDGKPYLLYACPGREGEETARRRGFELLGGLDFKIFRYNTRNLSKASSLYRGGRLDTTHSLKEASRRIGHDKSVKRLRNKSRPQGDRIW